MSHTDKIRTAAVGNPNRINGVQSISLLVIYTLLFASFACGPKTQEIELSYLIKDNQVRYQRIPGVTLTGKKPRIKAFVTVTNTSDYGGVFKFYAKFTSQGNTIELSDEEFIKPGEAVELYDEVEINPYSFEANVEVPDWGIIAPRKVIQL